MLPMPPFPPEVPHDPQPSAALWGDRDWTDGGIGIPGPERPRLHERFAFNAGSLVLTKADRDQIVFRPIISARWAPAEGEPEPLRRAVTVMAISIQRGSMRPLAPTTSCRRSRTFAARSGLPERAARC